jgi:hypothetical protein
MEKLYAELSIKIKKEKLDEANAFQKWQKLVKDYNNRGIDISDGSNLITPERTSPDELCFVLRSGEVTQTPDYKKMYALLGEFIQFLYEEMFYVGTLNVSLERKCVVFEIQTQIP